MPTRLIVDTDIGTDVDDCLALALILASPELRLEGVTCVYGDVGLRARMVRKLLRLGGRAEVPVFVGATKPLLGKRPVYWAGFEGVGLLDAEDATLAPESEHAVDYLIRMGMENPGQIHLLAIGPLTNVALAFLREPRLAQNLAHVTIMGGVCRGAERLDLPYCEHNIICDPESAHVVLASGAPITLVPLDVTTRVRIRQADTTRIRAAGTPYHAAVADQVELYPPFQRQGWTYLHDPLAAAIIVQPDLVGLTSAHVDVELNGQHTTGATLMRAPSDNAPANVDVALTVRAEELERFLVERLSRA